MENNSFIHQEDVLQEKMKTTNPVRVFSKERKYRNRPAYVDGIRFDSRKEANYYKQLLLEQKAGLIEHIERQKSFPLYGVLTLEGIRLGSQSLKWAKVAEYRVDFFITLPNGTQEVREIKSPATKTQVWELKRRLFETNYPEIRYKVIE